MNHADFETRYVEWGSSEYRTAHRKYKKATGRDIQETPTFWVEDTNQSTTHTQLLSAGVVAEGVIGWTVRTIGEFLFGRIKARREKRADKAPADLGEPEQTPNPFKRTPTEEPPEDWQGVRIIAYATTEGKKGKAIILGGNLLESKFKRLVRNISDGKAEAIIVRGNRKEAVIEKSGHKPDPIAILALIPKTSQGLIKGLAIKKAERKLRDKFPDGLFVLDFITERTDPDDYAAVIEALKITETTPETASIPIVEKAKKAFDYIEAFKTGGIGAIILLMLPNAWDRIRRKKTVTE